MRNDISSRRTLSALQDSDIISNMEAIIERIIVAMQNRRPISFEYRQEGKPEGLRVGNPHAIFRGRNKEGVDHVYVHIVQTSGVSETLRTFPDWRMFFADKIFDVQMLESEPVYAINEGYNPNASMYSETIYRL